MATVQAQRGFVVSVEQETDGRWNAAVDALPGALAYGSSRTKAEQRLHELVLRILADRIAHGEPVPEIVDNLFQSR